MAGSSRCIRRRPKTLLGGTGRGSKRQRDLRATEEGVVTRSGGSAMASANTPVRRLASVEELVVPDKNEPDLTPNELFYMDRVLGVSLPSSDGPPNC
nr:hypothetical protein Iba_chr11bCG11390 [Ipomoea batatas]